MSLLVQLVSINRPFVLTWFLVLYFLFRYFFRLKVRDHLKGAKEAINEKKKLSMNDFFFFRSSGFPLNLSACVLLLLFRILDWRRKFAFFAGSFSFVSHSFFCSSIFFFFLRF